MSFPICHVVNAEAGAAPERMVALDLHLHGAAQFRFMIPTAEIGALCLRMLQAAEAAEAQARREAEEAEQ